MTQTIKCKNCGAVIEVSEALTQQLREQIQETLQSEHKRELEVLRREIEERAAKDYLAEVEKNKSLSKQVSGLLDELRALRRKDEERELAMKKKLFEEEQKIRSEAVKKVEEEHRLKDLEKDKKLSDALKQVEELKSKIEQGSMQTQGEVLELELEERLRAEFPGDIVSEVKKGQRGADILHTVVDKLSRKCGTILWESKNAKWSEGWISKLKEDQRQAKTDLAVLVSVDLPKNIETYAYINGVWVTSAKHYIALALSLRFTLISLYHEKQNAEGKDEKMKVLYEYLTGPEFRHRVEGIIEAFSNLQAEQEREKRWYSAKWAREEKELRKVIDHTHGMYGDLQGVIGKSLPQIKTLELSDGK